MGGREFKIGDLVECVYELYDYYNLQPYIDEEDYPYHGIIIEKENGPYPHAFGYEILYTVLCLDGFVRYFADWELRLLNASHFSAKKELTGSL